MHPCKHFIIFGISASYHVSDRMIGPEMQRGLLLHKNIKNILFTNVVFAPSLFYLFCDKLLKSYSYVQK